MGAEVAVLVTALVAAAFLVNGSPPRPAGASDELLGPSPLEGATVRDAGLAGQLTVGIVADGQRLQLDVFTSTGPVRASDVAVEIRDPDGSVTDLVPRPCGPGCFTQHLTLDDGVTGVAVPVSAPEWIGGTFEGELVSPPGPPADGVLRDVVTTMRAIPELILTETVDSGPDSQVIPGTITISGDRFVESEPYAAANIDDARMMPGTPRRLALYIPGEQIYAVLELDDENRIVEERLVAPAHEITRTFTYPDD